MKRPPEHEPIDMVRALLAAINEHLDPTIGAYLRSEATRRLRANRRVTKRTTNSNSNRR